MRTRLLSLIILALTLPASAADGVPKGWFMAGTAPRSYRAGVDENFSAYLVSLPNAASDKFGTLMQMINAQDYAGKRVRFRASVKTDKLTEWAGLWMRVDRGSDTLVFDNMQSRPIKGTSDWKTYDVVEDIPLEATTISFGALMQASGELWLNHVTVEVVGKGVPTTAASQPNYPTTPVNLDFHQ